MITSTIAGEKGNTASSNALKPATVETGAEIMVPMFINEGDVVRISTIDRSYNERVRQ
jgi:elongation factor P